MEQRREAEFRDHRELTNAFVHFLSRENRAAVPLIAGTALLALDVTTGEWQRLGAEKPLVGLIDERSAVIDHLGTFT